MMISKINSNLNLHLSLGHTLTLSESCNPKMMKELFPMDFGGRHNKANSADGISRSLLIITALEYLLREKKNAN
jgi:hypothetical protein